MRVTVCVWLCLFMHMYIHHPRTCILARTYMDLMVEMEQNPVDSIAWVSTTSMTANLSAIGVRRVAHGILTVDSHLYNLPPRLQETEQAVAQS